MFRDEDDDAACSISRAPAALTSLTVPKLVLDEGTAYYWRAQFTDSNGTISGVVGPSGTLPPQRPVPT
ncbi:MAG: hypothetical protein MZV70_12010 [Desulfobacterales bacterium]|nr:hypothetical protein [Desulfobacterales bacterium]